MFASSISISLVFHRSSLFPFCPLRVNTFSLPNEIEPFKNWYSDDWLSEVYGSRHTFRSHPVEVRHHAKEQRYPTLEAKHLLRGEVEKGRVTISNWLQKNLPDVQL
jgi:hypothetical protein